MLLQLVVNVCDEVQVDDGDKAVKHFGKFDLMVSNAAILIAKPVTDFPYNEWQE